MRDLQPREIIQGWLSRARSDLNLGKSAMHIQGVLLDDACYHAQQCVEKALKGLLTHYQIPFPRTHVLEALLDLIKNNGIDVPINVDKAYKLTQYAVQTRYPGEWEPVTKNETKQALESARLVLTWVEEKIKYDKP